MTMETVKSEPKEFDSVEDALDAVRSGSATVEEVKEEFSHVDGIERSVAVARATRNNRENNRGEDAEEHIDFP